MTEEKTIITGCAVLEPTLQYRTFDGTTLAVGALSDADESKIARLREEKTLYQKLDRTVLFALLAARDLIPDSSFADSDQPIGVNISSSRGATHLFEESYKNYLGKQKCSPFTSPTTTLGNISSWVLQDLDLQGLAMSHSMTCSSALYSIGNALAWMTSGMSERFIVGASEAPLTDYTIAQMRALKIYSGNQSGDYPCRPLEESVQLQDSFVLGEGCGLFALERARSLPKHTLGVIESFGYGAERIETPTGISEDGECFRQSMQMALKRQTSEAPIDLILMHAPGTIKGDRGEVNAIAQVFADSPDIPDIPPLYSTKLEYGHTLAASGALSLYRALCYFKEKSTPEFPYPSQCKAPQQKPVRKVLINAAGFGGIAASVIVSSPELFH